MDVPTGYKSKWRLASGVLSYMSDTLRRQSGIQESAQNATQPFDTRTAGALLESAQFGVIALELAMDMQEVPDSQPGIEQDWDMAFDEFLTEANDMIDDTMLKSGDADTQRWESGPDDSPSCTQNFAKVYALQDPQFHGSERSPMQHGRDSAEVSGWVMVHNDAGRFKLLKKADDLCGGVRNGISNSIRRADMENQKHDLTDETDHDKLLQAEAISQSAEDLYQQICEGLTSCRCQDGHLCNSKLYLSDFDQIRLDLMIDPSEVWCPTICTDERYQQSKPQAYKVDQLCQTLQDTCARHETVQFVFGKEGLSKVPFKDIKTVDVSTRSVVEGTSLEFLTSRHSDGDKLAKADKRKVLAIIARALLVLYGGSWWQSSRLVDYVSFDRGTASSLPDNLVPHILRSFEQSKPTWNQPHGRIHQHPVFLHYGLLLLECEYGQKLKSDQASLCEESEEPYVVLKTHLDNKLVQKTVSDACRNIVEVCLRFDEYLKEFDQKHPRIDGNLKFRAVIYKLILKPLLQEIRREFSSQSLDGLDLPDWSNKTGFGSSPIPRRNSKISTRFENVVNQPTSLLHRAPLGHIPRMPSTLRHHSSATETKEDLREHELRRGFSSLESDTSTRHTSRGLLFDGISTTDENDIESARTFFELHRNFFREKIYRHGSQPRVRVAILDTGLDEVNFEENYELQGILRNADRTENPITKIKSFIGDTTHDSHGHGTHIAALLLKIAPHAELFIAKIANGGSIDDQGLQSVSRALEWAVSEEVDIISMSFGFPQRCYDYDHLASRIQNAYMKGIVLFAAASNQGANGSRSYPARDRHVICVHAFDGLGKDSRSFNPQAELNDDNFATLGLGIKCIWEGRPCYKSGTSFATPIAAGIAANSLQYALFHTKEGRLSERDKVYERLRTNDGMRKMFRLMTGHPEKYQWICPWRFWASEDSDQDHCRALEKALKR